MPVRLGTASDRYALAMATVRVSAPAPPSWSDGDGSDSDELDDLLPIYNCPSCQDPAVLGGGGDLGCASC